MVLSGRLEVMVSSFERSFQVRKSDFKPALATYYEQNGNAGACGEYNSDSAMIIAINGASSDSYWTDYSQKSPYCGRWVTIENTDNGKTVVAKVADVCPTCTGNGESIDLSVGAFQAIGTLDQGLLPIRWHFNN
jgi:expansin (peptidoglycan-binding protein)